MDRWINGRMDGWISSRVERYLWIDERQQSLAIALLFKVSGIVYLFFSSKKYNLSYGVYKPARNRERER